MMRLLATIALHGPAPLLADRSAFAGFELVSCGWGGTADIPVEALGLPAAALRFATREEDFVRLIKPHLLQVLCARGDADEVVFVDAQTLACETFDPPPVDSGEIRLWPRLPGPLAACKPSEEAAAEGGAGDPTGGIIQIHVDADVSAVLARWTRWMRRAYMRGADVELRTAEIAFLRTLPPSVPGLRWDPSGTWGHWADLHPSAAMPALIGIDGLAAYRLAETAAVDLIGRRTHSGAVLDDLMERLDALGLPASDEPVRWSSGDPVPDHVRSIMRAVDPWGARWPDPFDDTGTDGFRSWLEEVDDRGLQRLAQSVYWARRDLQASFPTTTPTRVLGTWMATNGLTTTGAAAEPPSPPLSARITRGVARRVSALLGGGEPTLATPRRPGGVRTGANVVGFARAESGLGEAMRATLGALASLDLPRAVVDLSDRVYSRQGVQAPHGVADGAPYDVTVLHVNPEEVLGYLDDSLGYRMGAAWNVGMWFWESDRVPRAWVPAFDVVDEVWAASSYLAEVFAAETSKTISVVGLPVEAPEDLVGDRARHRIGADELVVAYVTDAYSGQDRKNPLAALEAFRMAYGPRYEGVRLVLKISNLEKFPALVRSLRSASAGLPVTIIGEYLDRQELWELLACADVYLSLHASEGFGLTILEAMALGIPAVATGYGGNMDFTDEDNALLVGYDLVPASGGPGEVYARGGRWASPHVGHAADHLRRLGEDLALRRRLGDAARARAASFSPAAYQRRIGDRLRTTGLDVRT